MTSPHRDGNVTYPTAQFQAMMRGQYKQGCIDTRTQYLPILLDLIAELRDEDSDPDQPWWAHRFDVADRAETRLKEITGSTATPRPR